MRERGAAIAKDLCRRLKNSNSKYEIYAPLYNDLLEGLFSVQPRAALDGLFSGDAAERELGVRLVDDIRGLRKNPLDVVPEGELLDWCDQEPRTRYSVAAAVITVSHHIEETGPRLWTNIALRLLEKAPDRVEVLKEFARQFTPISWSNSRATIIELNAKLLNELERYPDPTVVEFIAQEKVRLGHMIEAERRTEMEMSRERHERFE